MSIKEKNWLESQLSKKIDRIDKDIFFYSPLISFREILDFLKISLKDKKVNSFREKNRRIRSDSTLNEKEIKNFLDSFDLNPVFNKSILSLLIKKEKIDKKENYSKRRIIIGIMGSVNHGKTTLKDTLLNSFKRTIEEGDITQNITCSDLEYENNKFVIIDTPGHSIFSNMRKSASSFIDIAILVIDGDEKVKAQTSEVISQINLHNIPTLIFINYRKEVISEKDKEKIKSQLQEENLLIEEWGGNAIFITGKANDRKDCEKALEGVIALSYTLDLEEDYNCQANGILIDNYTNKGVNLNKILIKRGKLSIGNWIITEEGEKNKVKKIIGNDGKILKEAYPGDIISIPAPNFHCSFPGIIFLTENDPKNLKLIEKRIDFIKNERSIKKVERKNKHSKLINIVLISKDMNSSVALESLVENLNSENKNDEKRFLRIVKNEYGNLNNSLIETSKMTKSFIFFFGICPSSQEIKQIESNEIFWYSSKIVYEIEEKMRKMIEDSAEKTEEGKELGKLQVIAVFEFSQVGKIAGCKVIEGEIKRSSSVKIIRKEKEIFFGKIKSLQKNKEDIKEAKKNEECGIVFKGFGEVEIGDIIISTTF